MRLYEISNSSRKVIRKLNSLYITYSTYNTTESYTALRIMLEETSNSTDIRDQSAAYRAKLTYDLIRMLKNES